MAEQVQFAEGSGTPAPATTPEPQLILGKFKDQNALVEAYTALEKRLGSGATPPAPATPTQPTPATPAQPPAQPTAEVADIEKYQQEFSETGKLSDETYAALAAKGFSKQVVDNYIAGQQAASQLAEQEVFSVVGGQEQYKQLVTWAQGLPKADQDAYNAVMATNDPARMKLAVQGLQARMAAAHGSDPRLIGGGNAHSAPTFANVHQMKEAIQDPRYDKDESYRQEVWDKIARMK